MQKKYFRNTKNLLKRSSYLFLLAAFFCHQGIAALTYYETIGLPLWRDFLKLPNNRWIWLKKVDEHKTKVILGKKFTNSKGKLINKVVWSEDYEEKHDALWDYAYFLKIKEGQYFSDINHDGRLEVAIMPFDNGNNMVRRALIFTVKPDRLELVKIQPGYNLDADQNVFK
jgi:hypothetical protein